MRSDVYQEITDRVIAQLETVQPGDFSMPWVSTGAGMPQSIANRAYRGINVPLLMIEASERGFSSNIWGTYKAWQAAGAQVRRGEKGTRVVFWKQTTYTETGDDGEDTERQSLFAKMYTVFAAEQVDGYKPGTVELPCKAAILETVETLGRSGRVSDLVQQRCVITLGTLESLAVGQLDMIARRCVERTIATMGERDRLAVQIIVG